MLPLLKVTPEAAKWRDLSPSMQRCEKGLRITLFILGLLTLAAMAISIYYCVPGVMDGYAMAGALIFATCLIGCIVGGLSFTGAIFVDFEKCRNGCPPNFKKESVIEKHFRFLEQKPTLKQMYETYYQKNGGLGPLVRVGLLSLEDGKMYRDQFAQRAYCLANPSDSIANDELHRQIEEMNQQQLC